MAIDSAVKYLEERGNNELLGEILGKLVKNYRKIQERSSPSFNVEVHKANELFRDICAELRAVDVDYHDISIYCKVTNEACLLDYLRGELGILERAEITRLKGRHLGLEDEPYSGEFSREKV